MTANVWSPRPETITQANAAGLIKQEAQVAAFHQRTFVLNTFAYTPGTGSLAVYKNGKILARNRDYLEFDNATVLLTDVCDAGDEITFLGFVGVTGNAVVDAQLRSDLGANSGAGLIKWVRGAAGAVANTILKWLGWQEVTVFEFMTPEQIADVENNLGLIDVTAAIQAGIDSCKTLKKILVLPPGTYNIAGSLTVYAGTKIRGSNGTTTDYRGLLDTTIVKFTGTGAGTKAIKTSQANLTSGYVWNIFLAGFTLVCANAVAQSVGIDLQNAASSIISDVQIKSFNRNVQISMGMMNTLERVNSSLPTEASFYITGNGVTTTQSFIDCMAREGNWGYIMESTNNGNSFGTIVKGGIIESTKVGGVSLHKSCGAEFIGIYTENAPDDRVITNGTTFSLHKDGVDVDQYRSVAVFHGGDIAGGNFNLFAGSTLIDCGSSKSVVIMGTGLKRATNGIRWDATTKDNAIQVFSANGTSITNLYVGPAGKLCGVYNNTLITGSPYLVLAGGELQLSRGIDISNATNGGYVKFPVVQIPSANPNTLDDYKEGTFDVALVPQTSGTITLSFKTLSYTKIGRKVTIAGILIVSAVAAPVGFVKMTGLPFLCKAGFMHKSAITLNAWFLNGATTHATTAVVNPNTSEAELHLYLNGNTVNLAGFLAVGSELQISGSYFTD